MIHLKQKLESYGLVASKSKIDLKLKVVAERLRASLGTPRRKSKMPDPLELLIATILSQNTNDINSHKAFINLKSAYPNLRELAAVRPRRIETLIRVGGLARKKSKVIVQVTGEIVRNFDDFDRRALRKLKGRDLLVRLRNLKGVGYKTASCVLLFSLGDDDAFPVDTHVHRILNRLGVVHTPTPDQTFLAVRDEIPKCRGYELHINLIKFGRKTCTAQKPRCHECELFDICKWKGKTRKEAFEKNPRSTRDVEFMLLESV